MFTSDFFKEVVMGTVRHTVTAAVPVLVASGVLAPDQTDALLGSVLFLAGLGWSWWQKRNQQKALVAAKQ